LEWIEVRVKNHTTDTITYDWESGFARLSDDTSISAKGTLSYNYNSVPSPVRVEAGKSLELRIYWESEESSEAYINTPALRFDLGVLHVGEILDCPIPVFYSFTEGGEWCPR